ncbi:MAG TPA: adenylate/guanylate cyclase domain-containing protein [Solirubrobacterales bacterium]|nr:adenylate/guanylate cyclase domain-containing protein [Solirubrobacterales bacterium]
MHKELRELLHSAEGQSRRVVVIFLDVRGFSSFAGIAESTDTAEFLKSVYIKVLDEFFPEAEFFKPTGDGLLILLDYTRDNLKEVVRSALDKSIEIVENFAEFCKDDPMINFEVPTEIGIGLARGSATSLTAKGKVLDYSGRPLNLASRLMDLARPSGVVFDNDFDYALLDDKARDRFKEDSAYVKGLAESKPMKIYCLEGYVEIPEYNKRPLDGFVRHSEDEKKITFKEFEQLEKFRHQLTKEPARTDNIEAHIWYPKVLKDGTKVSGITQSDTLPATFKSVAGKSFAVVDYQSKAAELKGRGIKGPWKVSIILEYSILPEDSA